MRTRVNGFLGRVWAGLLKDLLRNTCFAIVVKKWARSQGQPKISAHELKLLQCTNVRREKNPE